ncbi:serine hydrolase [Nannocystis pusilla]|uniref:Serine hydrolase n=1 Tax=Nannocystis pusilla TaxID=889268 RepID=A0A9X3F6W1_9BACT|nr:serine hydrolase [Nannocystis pusilla]
MREDPHRDLFDLLEHGVRAGVYPGCVALVWRDGAEVYHEAHGDLGSREGAPGYLRAVSRDTVYDLASLTKVLATTSLAALAVAEGRVELTTPVPAEWDRACPGATLAHLLSHSSGLPAHREYFADLRPGRPERVLDRIAQTPPEYPLGSEAVYSDLGFMILGAWLERLFAQPLDRLFDDKIAWPLDLHRGDVPRLGFHRLLGARGPSSAQQHRVAPTEVYDPALHPEGVPSWFACRTPVRCAHYEVHDDNAFVMSGVAGHAGLFGDAAAVLELARAWLECTLPGLHPSLRDVFWTLSKVPGSTRQLGWDSPSPDGSGTTADVLSARASGHTGFTGTTLWIDPTPPDNRGPLIAILLANRVHPTRNGPPILPIRQQFHRAAVRL